MTGIFPSMSAFGGVQGLVTTKKDQKGAGVQAQDKTLAELMSGNARMVDTYPYEYVRDVVGIGKPFAVAEPRIFQDGKIAIIGSGFAGTTAAYELSRAFRDSGMDIAKHIHIYEGLDRVGGRLYSPSFTDQQQRHYYNEMGAMRVPDNSKLFWNYFAKVETRGPDTIQKIFPNPGIVATELYFRGGRYSWIGDDLPKPDPDVTNPVNWKKVRDGVGAFVDSLQHDGLGVGDIYQILTTEGDLSEAQKQRVQNYWEYFLKLYEDKPFIAALSEFVTDPANFNNPDDVWGPTEFNMFSTLGFGTGGFGPLFPVCFLEIFRLFLWDYASEYSPSMAMEQIIAKFINLIYTGDPDSGRDPRQFLRMNTVAYVGLDAATRKPVVFYIDERGEVRYENYDYVVVATTLRSMQARLNLDAEVVPDNFQSVYPGTLQPVFAGGDNNMLRESMRVPHIMNSSKLFGMLSQKPWVNPQWSGRWHRVGNEPVKCVLTDTLARQMYFLDPYDNDPTAGSNVLISYNWGDDSVKIMGIQDYQQSQVITPNSNPDFNLKKAYELGIDSALPNNVVSDVLKTDIRLLSPGQQHLNLQSIVWQKEPMMFGAFKLDYPEQYYYTSQLVYQYHAANNPTAQRSDRVYLANNNCSFQGGWLEGASQSGVNAAAAVLKTMQANGEAYNFRMEALFADNPFAGVIHELSVKYELSLSEGDKQLALNA